MKWLLSDNDFNEITNNYEWDGVLFMLWDNGITSISDAKTKLSCTRFQYSNPDCPHCLSIDEHYELDDNRYKCKKCGKKFSITSKTYLEGTKLEYHKWFRFAYLVGEMKITTSTIIAKDLDVTQKTSWEMLELLRDSRKKHSDEKFVNGNEVLNFKGYNEILELLLSRTKEAKYEVEPEPKETIGEFLKRIDEDNKKPYEFSKPII